ncbi:hypothetical protein EEB11_18045 [Pseudotabrizicola sediminis]|uniref:Uncharacterized protein n=1 Tax=Pseudotabrizicola sediminis TaxID=2486418 RepID=A0ABY2KK96_9RHOB|nr:hypothetical protein EEB11_18045 [Pseudotabrizicola sediminis]
MTLFRSPIVKNAIQTLLARSRRSCRNRSTDSRIAAARSMRDSTTVKALRSRRSMLLKKNDPPQTATKRSSMDHSD